MGEIHPGIDYTSHSDIEVLEANSERAVGRVVVAPHHHQPYGVVHGGLYCTLVETLASVAAERWAADQGLAGCVGVHNATDFFRSTRAGVLIGEAMPIHRGRTQQVWAVIITREGDGMEVARGHVRLQNLTDLSAVGGPESP